LAVVETTVMEKVGSTSIPSSLVLAFPAPPLLSLPRPPPLLFHECPKTADLRVLNWPLPTRSQNVSYSDDARRAFAFVWRRGVYM